MTTGGASDGGDGGSGVATPNEDDARHVVTVFLRNESEILLLKRSDDVGTDRGQWGAVSGDAEGDPDAAARRVIEEETGLGDAVTVVRRGDPVVCTDDEVGVQRVVHPFLFDCAARSVDQSEKVPETAWVAPTELLRRETVPNLWTAYDRVRPTVETIADDTDHGSAWLSLRALEALRDEAGLLAAEDAAAADTSTGWDALVGVAEALLDARPSMTALTNRVNRVMSDAPRQSAAAVERAVREALAEALVADRRAADAAAKRLTGEIVLTLSRSGTVERALSEGEPTHVYVAESRPAREGVGVAERLARRGTRVTLVTDAAVAHVLATADVDRVVVGADTVFADGSVLNKTGTRGMAIAAAAESVPVDVVTAADKISATTSVESESGPETAVYDGDGPVAVENPTFDRTPAAYVRGVVTDRGVLDAEGVARIAETFRDRTAWRET